MGYNASRWTQLYLKRKYGTDKVAQIGTDGTLAAKSAIKFITDALGYTEKNKSLKEVFAAAVPGGSSNAGITLTKALAQSDELKKYAKHYPDIWEAALGVEGHKRSVGVHASGIVISPEPLTDITPLRLDSEGLETTEYDMECIEKFLVKFDLLKLDTLDLIERAKKNAGILGKVNINDINLNDPNIYERVYRTDQLEGIFQVESEGMRNVIKELQPNSFKDIGAVVALYRPGPLDFIPSYINRKLGKEKIVYPFDALEPVLKETYGIFVYQEQLMKSSQIIGGLTLGQADMIRKGTAKKIPAIMHRWIDLMIYGDERYKEIHRERTQQYPNEKDIPLDAEGNKTIWVDYKYEDVPYVEGGINRGFDEKGLLKLKDNWVKFGSYAFNKAH